MIAHPVLPDSVSTDGARVEAEIAEQSAVLMGVLTRNADALAAARLLLGRVGLVRLAAIGSSRHAAGYGAACLEALSGIPATVLPAAGAAVPLPRMDPSQAVIVVSQSGETPALLATAEAALAAGTLVVAVVNAEDSPLERLAQLTLHCGAGAETVVAATKSVSAQMLLLRALAAPVDADHLHRLVAAVRELSAQFDARPILSGEQSRLEHVVCGGVGAEWVADEIALKAAEMAGRLLTSESLVDHLHGPAAVAARTLAFVEPADPNTPDLLSRPGVISVGADPSYDLVLPTTADPTLDAIVRLVAGQLIILAWSRRLGEDADAPRGLAKVTRTH